MKSNDSRGSRAASQQSRASERLTFHLPLVVIGSLSVLFGIRRWCPWLPVFGHSQFKCTTRYKTGEMAYDRGQSRNLPKRYAVTWHVTTKAQQRVAPQRYVVPPSGTPHHTAPCYVCTYFTTSESVPALNDGFGAPPISRSHQSLRRQTFHFQQFPTLATTTTPTNGLGTKRHQSMATAILKFVLLSTTVEVI